MIRKISAKNEDASGTPIPLPDVKKTARIAVPLGIAFWVIALILWRQQGLDKAALFYFDPARVTFTPFVAVMLWFSNYGMAAITVLLALYLAASHFVKGLNAPLTIYLYTLASMALSGIAGDLLKEVIQRPRPVATFTEQVFVLSQSVTTSIPSGHATKSVALVLPFLFLVSNSGKGDRAIKLLLSLVAGGVCLSRVVLGAHYVSDVLAGIGMALVGLPLTMLFAHMILKQSTKEQLPMMSKIWGLLLIVLAVIFTMI